MGAIVLHEGDIAEMKTGEGKTLVATMPLYLNALTGENVHLVTVNDYLAKRDTEWMGPVYEALGMRAAFIRAQMPFAEKQAAYEADMTYGTNSEFGFDYLRDNMAVSLAELRSARPHVRDRGRGRLDPHRRGTHAADHLRRARDRGEDLLRLRSGRARAQGRPGEVRPEGAAQAGGRRRLRVRREVQDRLAAGVGDRERRALARHREPLRPAPRPARQPSHPGAEGGVALPARRRLRRRRRRGQDRRRVHRPHHGRPPLVGGPAPGDRGEGGRADQGGVRHARDDHAAELLPSLREARRHDGHRQDRGEGVPGDLRAQRRRDTDERAGRA